MPSYGTSPFRDLLPEERPWAYVTCDTATHCWPWQGALDRHGYGKITMRGVRYKAHQYFLSSAGVQIPSGMVIDHLCRVRHCVNPAHMEVVTVKTNTLRGQGLAGINARKTHCPAGHVYGWSVGQNRRVCRPCRLEQQRIRRSLWVEPAPAPEQGVMAL